jgi:signal transduction histidine kinase
VARLWSWAAVAAVLSGVTANVLRLSGDVSLAGPSAAAQALEIMAGSALIVVAGAGSQGLVRWLLAVAGAAWLAAEWASPAAPGAVAFTAGLIVVLAPVPLVLAARWQRPPAAKVPTALLSLAALLGTTGAVLSGPLTAAWASPRDAGCTGCPRDLIAIAHDVALSARLTQLGGRLVVAAALTTAAWLAWRLAASWRRGRGSVPSADLVADLAATTFAVAVAAGQAATRFAGFADPVTYLWHAAAGATLLLLSAAVAVPALRAAHATRVVARLAVAVADDAGRSAADALGAALRDGALQVAYPTSEGAWRDRHGQPVVLPAGAVTLVTDSGENIAALIHGSRAGTDPASVAGAVSAARLLLDTERIEAGTLARVTDLRSARRLAVEAADAARARMERDLHDGAQQGLVSLRYALGLAGAHAARMPEPDYPAWLADADHAAEQALADLRELAHGISYSALAAGGLADAVRTAVEHAGCAATIGELPAERLPEHVERAAYRFIADYLRQASRVSASDLSIAVRHCGQDLLVEVDCDRGMTEADWPPAGIADRIAAAGGDLRRASHDGRQQWTAILPCE